MAAPAYRTSSAVQSSPGFVASITPTLPAGWAAGDLMICVVSWEDSTSPFPATITTPAGWTQKLGRTVWGFVSGTPLYAAAVFTRIAQVGDTAPTFSFNHSTDVIAVMSSYTGVDSASPIDSSGVVATASASGTSTPGSGAYTTNGANELLLSLLCHDRSNGASSDITAAPSGEAILWNFVDGGQPTSIALADETVATAQTITSSNWTCTHAGNGTSMAIRIALNPTAGPASQNTNAPFITAPTALYTPGLDENMAAPFVAAATTLFTPALIADIANPFISAGTTLYRPALSNGNIGVMLGQSASISI